MTDTPSRRFGQALAHLRLRRGLRETEAARTAGVDRATLHRWEEGRITPGPLPLARLLEVLEASEEHLELALRLETLPYPAPASWQLPGGDLVALPAPEVAAPSPAPPASLEDLLSQPAELQQALVCSSPRFQTAELCLQLCAASEWAAAGSAQEALHLARLALAVATHVPAPPGDPILRAHACCYSGNALRVASELPAADEAFRLAAALREQAAPKLENHLLFSRSHELDLEASLRRDQRRLPEALELLNQALSADRSKVTLSRVLAKRGTVLKESGDIEGAIAALRRALPLTSPEDDPRLHLVVRYNLAKYLAFAGEHEEAATRLPEVRALCQELGNDLDLLRLSWTEGQLLALQGHRAEAASLLDEVRQAFKDRDLPYNAALAALELAVVYLEEGRTGEVKELAREMKATFQAVGVEREELASVRLFLEAAGREALTLEAARRAVEALRRVGPCGRS